MAKRDWRDQNRRTKEIQWRNRPAIRKGQARGSAGFSHHALFFSDEGRRVINEKDRYSGRLGGTGKRKGQFSRDGVSEDLFIQNGARKAAILHLWGRC